MIRRGFLKSLLAFVAGLLGLSHSSARPVPIPGDKKHDGVVSFAVTGFADLPTPGMTKCQITVADAFYDAVPYPRRKMRMTSFEATFAAKANSETIEAVTQVASAVPVPHGFRRESLNVYGGLWSLMVRVECIDLEDADPVSYTQVVPKDLLM